MKGISRTALMIALVALPGLTRAACPQYDAAVAAVEGGDVATASAIYSEIAVEPTCDDALRDWMGSFLARDAFRTGMDTSLTAEARMAAFQQALSYEPHWRSYAALARLEWDGQDYASAARDYQLAINQLVEGPADDSATEAEIAEVYQMASAAVALSPTVVAMPTTRSGEEGGLFATNIRGYEVTEVPLPITFVYATDDFDETGAAYAQMLADHLNTFAPDSITLSGHTDPIGSDDYNMELSEERAVALADFLRAQGYEGEITTVGFGRTQLPPAPPGIEPGSEEYNRIARRVTIAEN